MVYSVAYCLECRSLVSYTPDKSFVDHQGGGLRPNGVHCSASLKPVPPVVVPEWTDDEVSEQELQLYQDECGKKKKRKKG